LTTCGPGADILPHEFAAMKLPNGTRAVVDIRKLRDYCLDPHSPKGRNKI